MKRIALIVCIVVCFMYSSGVFAGYQNDWVKYADDNSTSFPPIGYPGILSLGTFMIKNNCIRYPIPVPEDKYISKFSLSIYYDDTRFAFL